MSKQLKRQHGFGVIEIVIIVAAIALLSVVGLVAYNSFQTDKNAGEAAKTSPKPEAKKPCSETASNGIFCSEDVGIKFTVPTVFKGKLVKADNYEIFHGPIDQHPGAKAGMSELVFSASISGTDNFTFSIAKEPLQSGYVGVYYALQNAYLDKESRVLSQVITPTNQYDSKTGITTETGEYTLGKPVPSLAIDGVRFYKMLNGDAGMRSSTYLAIIKDKVVKIELKHGAYMGDEANDPSTIDADVVFDEFDSMLKNLQVL